LAEKIVAGFNAASLTCAKSACSLSQNTYAFWQKFKEVEYRFLNKQRGAAMKAKRTWSTPSLSIYGKVEAVTTQKDHVAGKGKQGGRGDLFALTASDCH
jgi:hypothetical protein